MRNDLRFALRGLARNPGFALAAILTLALGVGAVTSIFSVADAVLLRPLPYPRSDRLVMVWDELTGLGVNRLGLYGRIFDEYRAQTQVFDAAEAFEPRQRNLVGDRDAERVSTIAATAGLLPVLGASTAIGRGFEDDRRDDVALLSHSLFMRHYGGDPKIVGQPIHLDGRAYTVIGVLPAEFEFSDSSDRVDIWTPLAIDYASGLGRLRMLARLKPWRFARMPRRAAMDAEARHLVETIRPHFGPNGEDPGFRVKLIPLREEMLGDFRAARRCCCCWQRRRCC